MIVKYLQKLVEKYTEYQMMITYSINIFYILYILVIFNNDGFMYLHAKLEKHCTQKEIQPKIIYSTGKWKIKSMMQLQLQEKN